MDASTKTILIVEDNKGLNLLLAEKINDLGYKTTSVYLGADAITWLTTNTAYLVILDFSLPDMNGSELLEKLRNLNFTIPPFIVSTGQGDEAIAVDMMKQGARDYLVKNAYFLNKMPEILKRVDKEIENEEKRKWAENKLIDSEQKYREMADSLPVGVFETDNNGVITFVNQTVVKWLQYSIDELLNEKNIVDFVIADESEYAIERSQKVMLEKNELSSEYTLVKKSGDTFPCIVTTMPIYKNNTVNGLRGTVVDISQRKQIETEREALFEKVTQSFNETERTKNVLNEIMERVSDGFVAFDKDFNYTFVNTFGAQLLNRVPGELIGKNYWVEFPEAKGTPFANAYLKALENQTPVFFEDYYVHWDRWFSNRVYPSSEGITIFFSDITKNKKSEQEAFTTNKRLQKAQSMAHVGNWEINLEKKEMWASDEAFKIYGIETSSQFLPLSYIKQLPLPEYQPFLDEALTRLISNNQPYDVEFQIKKANTSEIRSIHSIAELETDKQGVPVRVIGVIQDITEQKELENELRVLSNAIEQNPASIIITDTLGNIEYVNPKFTQVTDYTLNDALSKNPRILKSGLNPPELYTDLWDNLAKGNTWRGEFCNVKKNGELFWELAVIAPVFNNLGKITHYVAVKEDVTEKKETERKIMSAFINGEERERNRFSMELHDGLGPLLSSIKLYFQWIAKTDDPEKKLFLTGKGNHSIDEAIISLREISNNLSPKSLTTFGLHLALKNYIDGLNQINETHIELQSNIDKRFMPNIEITFYRIIHELINNCIKHADASKIKINLHYTALDEKLRLTYIDNGKGLDLQKVTEKQKGNGLLNMQYRIDSINGKIKMVSSPGHGFEVFIEAPADILK